MNEQRVVKLTSKGADILQNIQEKMVKEMMSGDNLNLRSAAFSKIVEAALTFYYEQKFGN